MDTSTPRVSVSCEIDDCIYSSTVVGDADLALGVYRLVVLNEKGACPLLLCGLEIPAKALDNPTCPCGKTWEDCCFRA